MSRVPGAGVLFVLPAYGGKVAAIDAASITGADLADALGVYLGGAEMLTPAGRRSPADVRAGAVRAPGPRSASRSVFARLPQWLRVAVSDARDWRRAVSMRRIARSSGAHPYRLVVQLHGRHHDAGARIARSVGAPLVLRLEALEVREEAAWGIRRRGWGRLVDRQELAIVRKADMVASVSNTLDDQLAYEDVEAARRVVIPNGVDVAMFAPGAGDPSLRAELGLEGRWVVGWIGGFRPFHGLEMIREIAERVREAVPEVTLCLVGTGPERDGLIEATRALGDTVRILDPVAHDDVPRWLRTFDACLLLAGTGDFHYSPMKLYEYLACGRPVVASGVGQVTEILDDGRNGLVVPAGDVSATAAALVRLARDRELGERLGAAARRTAVDEASWDRRARTLIEALEARGLLPAGATAPASPEAITG